MKNYYISPLPFPYPILRYLYLRENNEKKCSYSKLIDSCNYLTRKIVIISHILIPHFLDWNRKFKPTSEGLFTTKKGVRILNFQRNLWIFSDFSDFCRFESSFEFIVFFGFSDFLDFPDLFWGVRGFYK